MTPTHHSFQLLQRIQGHARQHGFKCGTVPGMTRASDMCVLTAREAANITHITFLAEVQLVFLVYHFILTGVYVLGLGYPLQ